MNGGQVRSPVPAETLEKPSAAFDVTPGNVRSHLEILNGSILNLVEDEEGPYWTYRHPTISDAFASYVAKSPELVEIYLRGAKPETMVQEVVCAGIQRWGAAVVVPNSLHQLLADRIGNLPSHSLATFISYRSNAAFSARLMQARPDLWNRLTGFIHPLSEDSDVDMLTTLHEQGLLPEERRKLFVNEIRSAVIDDADVSFIESEAIAAVLTEDEREEILGEAQKEVLGKIGRHVGRVKQDWDQDYDPADHFDQIRKAIQVIARELDHQVDIKSLDRSIDVHVERALDDMRQDYDPQERSSSPSHPQQSVAVTGSLEDLFRDVGE